MKKLILILSIILGGISMVACDSNNIEEPVKDVYTTIVEGVKPIEIEVDETYTMYYILRTKEGMKISVIDESIAHVDNNDVVGLKVGETKVVLEHEGKKQQVSLKVCEKGSLSSSFSFSKERLGGKKIVAFGDSVTANATIGGAKTYFNHFADRYKMSVGTNYAIGGTTATYTFVGSNIYKEYGTSDYKDKDGVNVVKRAYDAGELNDVDYAFIAYGHNDQYFQAPITVSGDDQYDINSFESCHSFMGSYRYMINTLKLANPDIRIILLDCTYSEYDKSNPSPYGKLYSYSDYRTAISNLANEFDLTYIPLWDSLLPYFDNYDNKHYYKDSVHLSAEGHIIIGKLISEFRENE